MKITNHGTVWEFEIEDEYEQRFFDEHVVTTSEQWKGDRLFVEPNFGAVLEEECRGRGFV